MLLKTKFIVKTKVVVLLHTMVMQYNLAAAYDCANYGLSNHDVDQYIIYARRCQGSEELGFQGRTVFHARFLREDDFNNLFKKVKKTHFEIRIEDSSFTSISMPMLTEAVRPKPKRSRLFVIRGNSSLKNLTIPRSKFDVQESFHVEIDGNPELENGVLRRFQTNCLLGMGKKCDIFPASHCDTLEDEEEVRDCAGVAVIKQAPGTRLNFNAGEISEKEFNEIFSQATHVQMCIILKRSNYKTLRMPKLKRLFPCKREYSSLVIANNPRLKKVILGKEALVVNMQVENNTVLPDSMITALSRACNNKHLGFCKIKGTGVKSGENVDQSAAQEKDSTSTETAFETTPIESEGLGGGNDEDYSGGFFGGPLPFPVKSKEHETRAPPKDKKEKKVKCHRCFHIWLLPVLCIALFL
ncbi:unnamed protein product [Cylicocyclus nassatus]|uniref:Receptor L-domain domain-containing protein n=1 Tax=Cylicocyclus nassatus TaxID=53992 RepID=A0AA36GPH2_CYLNA|nr:unnamed protein product [Cylicocyclus nassatus]